MKKLINNTIRKRNNKHKKTARNKNNKRNKTVRRLYKRGGTKRKYSDECGICLTEFTDPDNEMTLSCGHTFHKECMHMACEASVNPRACLCPMCRGNLTNEEMDELQIPIRNPVVMPQEENNQPPPIFDVDEFERYINPLLKFTITPAEKLNELLSSFLGTDRLPIDLENKIMVFKLKHLRPHPQFKKYQFIGLIDALPRNLLPGHKYYEYVEFEYDDDGSVFVMDLVEYN